MSDRDGLDAVVDGCTVALEGAGGAGRDLSAGNIATDGAAMKRHRIAQAFQDSRNVEWEEIYSDGLSILREESKDFYALWAVLAPLPIVRGHGFAGVAASLELCNRFLAEYWESMFPALPAGLNLRVSILSHLARHWTGFVKRATATEADGPAIRAVAERLEQFEARVSERIPAEVAPQTAELRQLMHALRERFAPDGEATEAGPQEAEAGVEAEEGAEAGATVPSGGDAAANELKQAYTTAVRLLGRRPDEALRQLGAVVERQATRAGKFRGQVYLGELYLQAGHARLARQMLTFLDEECGTIKLEDWEPELCGTLWATLYQALVAEHAGDDVPKDVKEKLDDLFARVCRVDAKQAVALKTS